MNKKELLVLPVVALLITVAVLSTAIQPTQKTIADTTSFDNPIRVYKNGELVATGHNTVTGFGLNNTRDKLMRADSSLSNWSSMQLSTGTTGPAQADAACEATIITTNGLGMANGTMAVANIGNFTVIKTWTASGTQTGIAKVCLHNATSNHLMASALISPTVNVASGDNLTVTYYIVVS